MQTAHGNAEWLWTITALEQLYGGPARKHNLQCPMENMLSYLEENRVIQTEIPAADPWLVRLELLL